MVHVPFKGGGPAAQSLLAGDVPMLERLREALHHSVRETRERLVPAAIA